MDEARFAEYIGHFNARHYDALGPYFAEDVTLNFANGTTLQGRDGITSFYRALHTAVREVLRVDFLLVGSDKVATELYTEFHAMRDFADFPSGPLVSGEVRRVTSFVHYELEHDEFSQIRVARFLEHPD